MNMGNLGQEDTTRMVKLALDKGINFIDTADVYSLGESETLACSGAHALPPTHAPARLDPTVGPCRRGVRRPRVASGV
jgi:predicted oxidoreductase